MTDKPFVTIKHAGSAKINDNDTGGQRLADIERVDGDLEVLRNTAGKNPVPPISPGKKIAKGIWVLLVIPIVAGIAVIYFAEALGIGK
ncbi:MULTISPECIES: hypothetical protein [unclassified Pseudomonas]|uniref:hypothetical protein n=1 Tax=unclassified Pseudomonas TaxID=196821 RepID=UPI001182B050|nr:MULTISPECIES: hypothetical protein [unclassified Pseudomonas]